MRRRRTPRIKPNENSSDDEPLSKIAKRKGPTNDDSSSESDIENYLQPPDKLDFNSPFFNPQKENPSPFDKIESDILMGVTRLSDSNSDEPVAPSESVQNSSSTTFNFGQLHEYTKKMEEARKHVEEYNVRKKAEKSKVDVGNLLAAGEGISGEKRVSLEGSMYSSDFESCSDSEREGWEEVEEEQKEKNERPKEGLEITVEMPNAVRKKKGVDLLAAIKRRINRVRKENQVLIHKVHLLCWIAHGNHVSAAINSENVLAMALSLVPSQQLYPPERADLKYLEQLLKWYWKTIVVDEETRPRDTDKSLSEMLEEQIVEKEAYDRRMFVFIFVAIVRSLGIQCRVVLSFQVEPLRPPSSELHSLSTKVDIKTKDASEKDQSRGKSSEGVVGTSKMVKGEKPTAKSTSEVGRIEKKEFGGGSEVKKKVEKEKKKPRARGEKKMSVVKNTEDKSETKEVRVEITRRKVGNEDVRRESEVKKSGAKSTHGCAKEISNKVKMKELRVEVTRIKMNNEDVTGRNKAKVEAENKKSKPKSTDGGEKKMFTVKTEENGKKEVEGKVLRVEITRIKLNDEDTKRRKCEGKNGTKKGQKRKYAANCTDEERTGNSLKGEGAKKENFRTKGKVETEDIGNKKHRTRSKNEGRTRGSKMKFGGDSKELKESENIIEAKKTERFKFREKTVQSQRKLRSHKGFLVPQLDGASDTPGPSRSNVKKGKKQLPYLVKLRSQRLERLVKHRDSESENDSLSKAKHAKVNNVSNLKKLKKHKTAVRTNPARKNIKQKKDIHQSKTVRKQKTDSDDDDSEYVPEAVKKNRYESDDDFVPADKVKKKVQGKKEEEKNVKKMQGVDVWAEVFLEDDKRWISVDVFKAQVHCVNELCRRATHPVSYVVAWNNDNTLKDITKRYCTNFNTVTRKLRIDAKWWENTLKSFTGKETVRDKEEDEELERQQLEKPLPTTIAAYKNHPLYVLKRHLLKYEAIYPPDAPTLGFVRNEPVYSRQCVHILHPRDIWLKQAKVVKPGEQPYKIVKGKPRWDRLSRSIVTDPFMDIFGLWQTQDYEPPTAENGIVPRNAYGNVELFKPCMLPKKTVHLRLPGLNKVAKKMNIDCASAFRGFEYSAGWFHPAYDGFVVCEEFADVLVAAWEQEQEEMARKEQEKVDKRVYGNWKKLIRGLLIRERLKKKYEFGETSGQGKKKKAAKKVGSTSDMD